MPPESLIQLCELVADVAMTDAKRHRDKLMDLGRAHSIPFSAEHILKILMFMNWTFAQGVWSNLRNKELRVDLQVELKGFIIIKLAQALCGSEGPDKFIASTVLLTDEFNSYVLNYTIAMKKRGHADAGTARLFALERIQKDYAIDDMLMNLIVPLLFPHDNSNSEVESVSLQVNKIAETMQPRGLLRRFLRL